MSKIKLGQKAIDKITGFEGIVVSHVEYLFGCDQYGLAPKSVDGKGTETGYFDEGRIEVTGPGIAPEEVKAEKNGGINRDCPAR